MILAHVNTASGHCLSYLDLLIRGDSTEDYLCKPLGGEHAKADPAYNSILLH